MAKKNGNQKKKTKRMRPGMILICFVFIGISAALLINVIREVITTVNLQQQLSEVQEKLQEVQDENAYLNEQKEKLQDPDYVENYARGNYQLTKDGEQIFYLPEKES